MRGIFAIKAYRLLLEGPLEDKISGGRPRTEWITEWSGMKYDDLDTGSRSGAMECHDSQPSQRRRHLMMMMNA